MVIFGFVVNLLFCLGWILSSCLYWNYNNCCNEEVIWILEVVGDEKIVVLFQAVAIGTVLDDFGIALNVVGILLFVVVVIVGIVVIVDVVVVGVVVVGVVVVIF